MPDQSNFTVRFKTRNYEVHIDPVSENGFFTLKDYGDRVGALIFMTLIGSHGKDVLELIDYDSVHALPAEVIEGLRLRGYLVGPEYD